MSHTTAAIGSAGEFYVAKALAAAGFSTNIDTKGPGSCDIEGRTTSKGILVQVKTCIHPATPAQLNDDEKRNITARAKRLGFEAWEARVTIDDNLRLAGDIAWQQLV